MSSENRLVSLGSGAVPDGFRPDIPPHVADVIRSLHPDLKRSIKSAVRAIAANPECGDPLRRELEGLQTLRRKMSSGPARSHHSLEIPTLTPITVVLNWTGLLKRK